MTYEKRLKEFKVLV